MQADSATASAGIAPPPWWIRALIGRNPKRTLLRTILWAGIVVLLFRAVWLPIRVQGISMLPTYRNGSVNFINLWAYRYTRPRRGDVVAIRLSAGRHVMYLKRIVGLPGERIAIHRGVVWVNGTPLNEPYVSKRKAPWNWHEVRLGPQEYFVVGDNRNTDFASHKQGKADASQIVGKVLF